MNDDFEARLAHLDGDGATVVVRGDVDIATAARLQAVLLRTITLTRRVIIDMSHVGFMDAAGVRVLDDLLGRVCPCGSVTVLDVPRHIHRLFTITGHDRQLNVVVRRPEQAAPHAQLRTATREAAARERGSWSPVSEVVSRQ